MKKSISSFIFALAALSVFFFNSCEVGLGESPDLEAPEITITSITSGDITIDSDNFGSGVYCKKTVIVRGTAIDNRHVSSVSAEIKWDSETEYKPLKTASLNGSEWVFDITFEKEGNVFVKFTASDDVGNSSIKSVKNILLFVDDEAPVSNGWYIKRENGFQYNLQTLETLKSLNLDDEQNKDAAQNVKFSIFAGFNDTMGIKDGSLKIKLRDENKNTICEISKKQDASNYAPQFDVTHELLTQASAALGTGIHYIEVLYEAEDIVSIPESNKAIDVSAGWFIWWPESDLPRITNSALKNDEMVVHIKDSLSISLFDDDELGNAYFALLKTEDDEEISADAVVDWSSYEISPENVPLLVSASDRDVRSKSFVSKGERETVISLTAPATAQKMRLLAIAWDNSAGKKIVKKDIKVTVIDDANPLLIIESPESNKIPSVTMEDNNTKAKITIKGMSLDTIGCSSLEFAWVPDSVASNNEDKETKAKAALNHQPGTPGSVITYEGIKVWSVVLGSAQASGNFKQQNFQFDLDLLNDFTHGSTNEKKNDKFFVVKLTRNDGKFIYQDYKLAKDNQLPVIKVLSPDHDMSIQESTSSFDLMFTAEKASGLPIQQNSYTIERIDVNPPVPLQVTQANDGSYKATISQTDMNDFAEHGTKPKYKFSATDIFENTGSAQYTIVVSDLPKLVSITTTAPALCKETDEIIFNLNFSGTVEVDSNLTGTNRPYLKLKGISNSSNSDKNKAYYKDGSGSTTLQFAYEVQPGDTTGNGILDVDSLITESPLVLNGATKLGESYVHLSDSWTNSITEKNIKIDGIKPQVTSIVLSHDIADSDVANYTDSNGYIWLKEGRTLIASVTMNENVSVKGSPSLSIPIGSGIITLPFLSSTENSITFSGRISSTDSNGKPSTSVTCSITDEDAITDTAGNSIQSCSCAVSANSKIEIDTIKPSSPIIKASDGTAFTEDNCKSNTNIKFYIDKKDTTDKEIEYFLSTEASWAKYDNTAKDLYKNTGVAESARLMARSIDYAGNISDPTDAIDLEIKNTFPNFTLECTSANGYFKAGESITFKVTFSEKVNIATDSEAKIYLTGVNTGDIVSNDASAKIDLTSKNKTGVTSATFTYIVEKEDQFTLKVSKDVGTGTGVHLDGITDLYSCPQGTKSFSTTTDFTREITCDGIIPYITSMSSEGEKITTTDKLKIYPNGNKITLNFNEPVQKGSGNITLRQVKGWAIPPVIDGPDFNTILNALPTDNIDGTSLTGSKILYMDGAQDSEWLFGAKVGPANDRYHGTGQYIGPYKKSSYGIDSNGNPDTSAKYVLDFDMDIWETSTNAKHYFGTTFESGHTSGNTAADGYSRKSTAGQVVLSNPTTNIPVEYIRKTLEVAGYHQRVLDVTSSAVELSADKKTVTITFPKGLTGTAALPDGREWELVIEKGAFLDYTQNEFGEEYTLTSATDYSKEKLQSDSIMQNGGTLTSDLGDWGRGRTTATDPVVLIQTSNGKNSFWSDKVATPVIRVDRYSYGLGAFQPSADSAGGEITSSKYDSDGKFTEQFIKQTDANTTTAPTGYVRVRIDCETRGATINYDDTTSKTSKSISKDTKKNGKYEDTNIAGNYEDSDLTDAIPNCMSYFTSTSISTTKPTTLSKTYSAPFAGGNGDYTKSCKQYIFAQATKGTGETTFTASDVGKEGVFQTVAHIITPIGKGRGDADGVKNENYINQYEDGRRDLSIRGTTGFAGEPYISPFPLRDSQIASPFLKRAYNNNDNNYYWVSYEILVYTSFSNYCSNYTAQGWDGQTWHNESEGAYDWSRSWGVLYPGEFTRCTNMRRW